MFCHMLRIMCCTIKLNILYKITFYLTKLYAESLCTKSHYFNSAACSQGSEPEEPLERRPLSFSTPELQCVYEHQGPSSPTVWRNISSLKSAIMHKEVTFKINQWKLDFPLALRGWSRKPFDSSSSFGPRIKHSLLLSSGPVSKIPTKSKIKSNCQKNIPKPTWSTQVQNSNYLSRATVNTIIVLEPFSSLSLKSV